MTAVRVPPPMARADSSQRESRQLARRRELAAFLRSRRERMTPAEVGLPVTGRRRTPGLRREEVAALAGLGITWYTWLEQARDICPSRSVLNALARTLLLDQHERRHLFALAGVPLDDPEACHAVSPAALALLHQLEPLPALVQNPRFDVLAYNRGFAMLFPELTTVAEEHRNMLLMAFTIPAMRARFGAESMARMVATFRAAFAEHGGRAAFGDLVGELRGSSAEFAALWERHDVRLPENLHKEFAHEDYGVLSFEHTQLWIALRSGVRMIVLLPADERTRSVLDTAVGRTSPTPLLTLGGGLDQALGGALEEALDRVAAGA